MELIKNINKKKQVLQKKINNIHIWSTIAIDSLISSSNDDEFLNNLYYVVPSKGGERKIKRKKEDVEQILESAIEQDLYFSLFTFLIAQVEAFLYDVAYEILKNDNRRLKTTINGINHLKKIDLNEVIEANSIEDMIDEIIKRELISVFYASPQKQKEYFERVLNIEIDNDVWLNWFEQKATRDIIIHNSGLINEMYLNKAGQLSRGLLSEKISIDQYYFNEAIINIKSMAGKMSNTVKKNYKEMVNVL